MMLVMAGEIVELPVWMLISYGGMHYTTTVYFCVRHQLGGILLFFHYTVFVIELCKV